MDTRVKTPLELRYVIDGLTPETLPMARLADYVREWAVLLGETSHVHFDRVSNGSAVLVAKIEPQASPKVAARVSSLRDGTAPAEVRSAYARLDNMLVEDHAAAVMVDPQGAEIIPFQGRHRPQPVVYGPFDQEGTLDGTLVRVGGKRPITAFVDDGHRSYKCVVTKELAKRLASHLYETVRVTGTGRWSRDGDGKWLLHSFRVGSFEKLDERPLSAVLAELRAVPGNGWRDAENPYHELHRLRYGED
jgi:hypothetical protein